MSAALPSAEVAADFQDSLQDLQINNRYEISNLTIIAKENTEHAMAISRVLEAHIRTTAPDRKLPALYVLDSIVKNVGTPYTIYLGRNLYSTFMDAYTLVGAQVRKSMEAMLKTWKEPVPGSMESRPVFSLDVTRSIETALIKARTAAVQQQQRQGQGQNQRPFHSLPSRPNAVNQAQWRNTPTPPNAYGYPPPPGADGYNAQPPGFIPPYAQQQPPGLYQSQYPPHGTPVNQYPHAPSPYRPLEPDNLNADLERLIASTRATFAANMYDVGIQQKLKALLDLQTILQNQQISREQRQMIKDQVAQLSAPQQAIPANGIANSMYPSQPQPPPQQDLAQLLQAQQYNSPAPSQPNISTTNLAQLLAGMSQPNNAATPQPPPATQLNGLLAASTQPTPAANPLLESLRAAGLLPAATDSPRPGSASLTHTPPTLPAQLPNPKKATKLGRIPLQEIRNDIQLTAASLKIPRPHLVSSLYEALPNQCTMCGRRFSLAEDGKQRKARHLDWHFRTNQRLQDAAKRTQTRSYYIKDTQWVDYREPDNADALASHHAHSNGDAAAEPAGAAAAARPGKKESQLPFVKAPADAASANHTCPICQEKFEAVWHEAAQDWVWLDAVRIGERVFHASCHAEVNKDQASAAARGTPDPTVLGKRKAEGDGNADARSKLKREVAAS